MEKFTIEDLRNGKCSTNGNRERLQQVIKAAFPKDHTIPRAEEGIVYFADDGDNPTYWDCDDATVSILPFQDAADFVLPGEEEKCEEIIMTNCYSDLCKFFNEEHNLILVDSEIQDIIEEVKKFIKSNN